MRERVLIWGAGAMGGTLGAFLQRAGHDVTLVDIVADHVVTMRDPRQGLSIVGPVKEFTVAVPSFLPDEVTGQWRVVILAVKGQHTAAACHALAPHLASDGFVLSLQNGLCEKTIAEIVGSTRTVGAFVNYAADWLAPGRIIFGTRGAVTIGELDGRDTPRLRRLLEVLRDFEPEARITHDIWGDLWSKIVFSAMLIAQACVRQTMVECFSRDELLPVWRRLCGEVVEVARAERVSLHAFNGFDPYAFTTDASKTASANSVADVVEFLRPGAKVHSGPWRDIAIRKRPTGVESMLGQIVEIGATHGLPCPALRRLIALVQEIERGRRQQDDSNLLELVPAPV